MIKLNLLCATSAFAMQAFAGAQVGQTVRDMPSDLSAILDQAVKVTAVGPGAAAENSNTVDADIIMKRSADIACMVDYWDMVDTIVDGEDAIIMAKEKFLPRFHDEENAEYDARSKLTKFTNVYLDIIESLAAKPFEEPVSLIDSKDGDAPTEIENFIEDVDGSGNNITVFAANTFFNGINAAIDWIFVDYSQSDPNIKTVADVKAAGLRPYWSHVLGRNVLDAKSQVIGGKETLTYIKIYEPGNPDHVRMFFSDGTKCIWQLWRKLSDPGANGKPQFILDSSGEVSIGCIPLVPFITGRRNGRTYKISPAMKSAATLQKELYQQESGLKFAKTMTAYPMLAGNGITPPMSADGKTPLKLRVGPSRILYSKANNDGSIPSWMLLEPAATSLTFLAADVKDTIAQLRELGRQPLTVSSSNLTVITTAVAAGKSRSAVSAWALRLKDTLENALVLTGMFYGISVDEYSPKVNVYNEFDEFTDNGTDLATLDTARAAKDLSQETYWLELKRRRVLSPEFDADEETKRLLKELPGDEEMTPPITPPVKIPGANQITLPVT